MREPAVYIITNKRNGTLYTGVTSNLSRRIFEHRTKAKTGFASTYDCVRLVWYENYDRMEDAIAREKQIKAGSRKAKLKLIEEMNPSWTDLYPSLA